MVISLYCMVICFCAYIALPTYGLEKLGVVALFLGIAFFWIANGCYDNTISKLKGEIKDLKKEIDRIKHT